MFDIEFWKNFLSNALATFVGAIIGIPVALWINRIQHKATESTEKKKFETEAKARKKKILELIRDELSDNKKLLDEIRSDEVEYPEWEEGVAHAKTTENAFRLKTELWRAFSDGGELHWIQDLDLLRSMALAYDIIRMVLYLGEKYTSLENSITLEHGLRRVNWPKNMGMIHDMLYQQIERNSEVAITNIDNALRLIGKELNDN